MACTRLDAVEMVRSDQIAYILKEELIGSTDGLAPRYMKKGVFSNDFDLCNQR